MDGVCQVERGTSTPPPPTEDAENTGTAGAAEATAVRGLGTREPRLSLWAEGHLSGASDDF